MSDHPNGHSQDEIIAEVRASREALAAEHGYDVRRLFAELKRREQSSDRPKAEPSPRRAVREASV